MIRLLLGCLMILLGFTQVAHAADATYTVNDVQSIVPKQTSEGWWHKQIGSIKGNKYLSDFKSKDHIGKINWNKGDLKEGKIQIVKAMRIAKQWCDDNKPFGGKQWDVETVTLRFRSGNNEVEYIYAIEVRTPGFKKSIEVIVLPNFEIIPPTINPKSLF
ncbi:MAG: hypothetical protein ABW153_13595 [Sedimenticola sp.]